MSNGINIIKTKIPKLIKTPENSWFILPRQCDYRYALYIDICYRNPIFGKYSLHILHGQSIQSHFLTLSLNWTSELICPKFSGKTAEICKTHFYSSFSFRCKLLKVSKILCVISPFKHVDVWRIQVVLCFKNIKHQSLDVSIVITKIIIVLQQCTKSFVSRRFYLTRDMTNLYPFIQGWLEWPFSELFSANVSLWKQYKFITFGIFSCRILVISYKILIITGISNEKTNELTTYVILSWNVTVFYRQELVSLFQVQENWKRAGVQN